MAADEVYRSEPGRAPLVMVSALAPGFACDESNYMDAVASRVSFEGLRWNIVEETSSSFPGVFRGAPNIRIGLAGGPRRDLEIARQKRAPASSSRDSWETRSGTPEVSCATSSAVDGWILCFATCIARGSASRRFGTPSIGDSASSIRPTLQRSPIGLMLALRRSPSGWVRACERSILLPRSCSISPRSIGPHTSWRLSGRGSPARARERRLK